MQGDWITNGLAMISGLTVMFCLGYALMGYINVRLSMIERGALLVASVLVLTPFPLPIMAGTALLLVIWLNSNRRVIGNTPSPA